MIPIYICDDEPEALHYLSKIIYNSIIIKGYSMEIVLETTDPEEILRHKEQSSLRSIYFLDVDLKNKKYNGFTLAKELRGLDTRGFLIYVTTHEELIFETFKYRLEAMSYLTKDNPQALFSQIQSCLEEINNLINNETGDSQSYYSFSMGDYTYQIPLDEILYFETSAVPHKVILHTQTRVLEFRGQLSIIEEELSDGFARIHRSYLIHLKHIKKVQYAQSNVILDNDTVCLLSRKGKKLLHEYFQDEKRT